MSGDAVFLRPQAKLEPLVGRWYAWSHLIAPAQHAMNLTYRQLPLLQSFLATPSVHLAATRDPKMFGGPFVNLAPEDAPRVKQLVEQTNAGCSALLKLAGDLKELDKQLQDRASGYSLNEFYAGLPESLRGVVELVYDLNNHPQIRIHEDLLYEDDLGADQQEILLTTVAERERHFFMSTPRLDERDNHTLKLGFGDPRLDALASMRSKAGSFDEISRLLDVPDGQRDSFRAFFTTEAPTRQGQDYRGDGVRVRYFGHACVLIQTDEVSVLLDPMLAFENKEDGRLSFDDLPPFIDYVFLTHNHQDHTSPEMLLQLRHRIGHVLIPRNNAGSLCDPSMKLILKRLGFKSVQVLEPFDTVKLPGGELMSLPFPGEHVDLDIHTKQAAFLSLKGHGLMFLVDSDGWDVALYQRIMRRLKHKVDVLFLGMECHGAPLSWLYGPLLTKRISRRDDESRRLSGADCGRAWNVLQEIQAPQAFVYAMGQEPWLRFIMGLEYQEDSVQLVEANQFVKRCRDSGVEAELLYGSREFTL
ncbi:MBL fold metallo-hydrolase [Dyella tabacisoli]|uniref:MBL fold metallo-hydrolase n=2 Tax=Dyella tabacisoli TaxID=2282381 RepID=A0A369UI40_9GAMM|nr:MBL fold metallo-hydrolase [Dyella tabacisoli]